MSKPGVFVYSGAWYDGWETRRHNPAESDWVVIRLGVAAGRVCGVEIDTTFFTGNQAPEVSVEGCFAPGTGEDVDAAVADPSYTGWTTILGRQPCGPNARHAWRLPALTSEAYTHVRLHNYPDGGIARFRLYGLAQAVWPASLDAEVDLAAMTNGALATRCSDQHYGRKDNLLLPGRGVDMGDGWETKRTRGAHVDWVVVRLAAPGELSRVVVDTAHFRGNFPQRVQLFAAIGAAGEPAFDDAQAWEEVLSPQPCGPDREHAYAVDVLKGVEGRVFRFVKMVIIPDGGVKRLRVFGRRRGD